MFRVTGRDAQGHSRELSVNASTEEQARVLVQASGLVSIERISVPPDSPAPRRLSPMMAPTTAAITTDATLPKVPMTPMAEPLENEPAGHVLRTQWLTGAVIGAGIGLLFGIGILLVCYRAAREPRGQP